MTIETDTSSIDVQPPRRPWLSRLIEVGIWFVAPFALMLGGIILALIFGAPYQRVIGVFAVIALGAGGYFMYRPSTRLRVRRARAAGLIYTGLFALIGAVPTSPSGSEPPAQVTRSERAEPPARPLTAEEQQAQAAQRAAQETARQQAAAAEAAATADRRRTEYIARLDRELESATPERMLENTDTPDTIIVTVAVFTTLAGLYRDGASLELTPDQEQARQRFKRRLIALQVQVFPELRNRYGPAMARRVWENDMEVRTVGNGYRTIDLIWGGFAANRNIAEFHRNAVENFEALRFTRARYFWYRGADRWQYYTLDVPSDRDLVVLSGGRFVTVPD